MRNESNSAGMPGAQLFRHTPLPGTRIGPCVPPYTVYNQKYRPDRLRAGDVPHSHPVDASVHMAQQMITLEEAAEKLGISPEEMKKRLKTDPDFRRLSQIRDGSTVRFKLAAIEELARSLGMASEQDLPLAPLSDDEPPGSDDFKVQGLDEKKKAKKAEDAPLEFGSSEEDVFSLTEDPAPAPAAPSGKSSGKLTPNKPAKGLSDSSAGGTDSDVRLDGGKKKGKADESAIPTEEIALDFSGPGSAVIKGGSSAKRSEERRVGKEGK